MARISGKNARIEALGLNLSGESNTFTLNVDNDLIDVTAFADTSKEFVEGDLGWSIDFTTFFDQGAANLEGTLIGAIGAGEDAATVAPQGNMSGNTHWNGNALIESWSMDNPVEGAVVLNMTLRGNGNLVRGTYA